MIHLDTSLLIDLLRETDLVVFGEEVVATDVLEVEAYEILVIAVLAAGLHVLDGHCAAFRSRCRAGACSRDWGFGIRLRRIAFLVLYRPSVQRGRDVGGNPLWGSAAPDNGSRGSNVSRS